MADCSLQRTCLFFQNEMDYMPGTAGLYRAKYCTGSPSDCARRIVHDALGSGRVPEDLFPYQETRGRGIVAEHRPRCTA